MGSGAVQLEVDTKFIVASLAVFIDSTAQNHPVWKKGIRIGSGKDGKVEVFVPGAAEKTLKGVTRYLKE